MKEAIKELIKTESRRDTFGFIVEIIQRGKPCPKMYKHYLLLPAYLYEEFRNKGIIDFQSYFIDKSAFFEFNGNEVKISFVSLYLCEDLHRKIDHYLIVKFAGSYPIKRGGTFF